MWIRIHRGTRGDMIGDVIATNNIKLAKMIALPCSDINWEERDGDLAFVLDAERTPTNIIVKHARYFKNKSLYAARQKVNWK